MKLGVELHRAGAERNHARIDADVVPTDPGVVTDDLGLGELGEVVHSILAQQVGRKLRLGYIETWEVRTMLARCREFVNMRVVVIHTNRLLFQ